MTTTQSKTKEMAEDAQFLDDLMTRNPVTVDPDSTLDAAMRLFDRFPFRHLPVVENEAVIGILSDRDLQLATGWLSSKERNHDAWGRTLPLPRSVREIMVTPVLCANPTESPIEAASTMLKRRIGALPVVDEGLLVGIVTETDILRAFCDEVRGGNAPPSWNRPVSEHMQSRVVTLEPETEIEEALDRCLNEKVRHLPVVEDGKLIGMLSDRDIRLGLARSSIADATAQSEGRLEIPKIRVFSVMTQFVIPIRPDASLHEAAEVMARNKFSALPVVDKGQPVGMITQTDILRHFASQT